MNSESNFETEAACNSTHFYRHEASHCEHQNLNCANEHCLRMNDIENIHIPCQDCCDRSNNIVSISNDCENLWIHKECHQHCDNHLCIGDQNDNCGCNPKVHKTVRQKVDKKFHVERTENCRDNSASTTDINCSPKCEKIDQSTKYEEPNEPVNCPRENSEKTSKVCKRSSDTKSDCPVFGVFFTANIKKLRKEDRNDYKEEHEEVDFRNVDISRSEKLTKKDSNIFRRFKREGRSKERRKRSTSSIYRAEESNQPRVLFKQSSSEYNRQSYNPPRSNPRRKDYGNLENVPSRHREGYCCPCGREPYISGTSIASSPRDSCIISPENQAFRIPSRNRGRRNPRQFDSFKLPSDMNVSRGFTQKPDEYSSRRMSSERFKDAKRRRHSTCHFCSRRCTPSKSSLIVETGGSAVRFPTSGSTTETEHFSNTSIGSITTSKGRKGYKIRTKMKSSKSQDKFRDYKNPDPPARKCSPECRGIPGCVGQSYSDESPARERYYERDTALHRKQEEIQGNASSTDYVWRRKIRTKDASSNTKMYSKDGRECKTQTESVVEINAKTTHSETCQRSLWSGIQKGKIWTQMQDAYKNVVKIVATNVNQILKDPNKGKSFRKNSAEPASYCVVGCQDNCQGILKCKTPSACDVYNKNVCGSVHCPSKQNANITNTPECAYSASDRSKNRNNSNETVYRDVQRNRGGSDRNSSFPKQKRQHPQQCSFDPSNEYNDGLNCAYNQDYQDSREQSFGAHGAYNFEENSIDDGILDPTEYLEIPDMKAYVDTGVQAGAVRADAEPLSASHRQGEMECTGVLDNEGNSRRCDRNVTCTSKWATSSVEDVDSMVQALSSKQRRMRQETQPSSSRKLESRYLNSGNRGSKTSSNNNKSQAYEAEKGSGSPNGKQLRKSPVKEPKNQKEASPPSMKSGKRCHTIRRYQIVCVDDPSKKMSDEPETKCLCAHSKSMMSKSTVPAESPLPNISESVKLEDASTQPEISARSDKADDKSTKSVIEETKVAQVEDAPTEIVDNKESDSVNDPTTGETAILQDTIQEDVKSTPVQEDPASTPAEEVVTPTPDPDTEVQETNREEDTKTEVKEEIDGKADDTFNVIGETPVASSTLKEEEVPKENSASEPIEYVREHNGGRTRVNVQMQTSNTILTKILSEFEVGNKKKRIVMSIKLQTESDNSVSGERQDAPAEVKSKRSAVYIASSVSNLWTTSYEYLEKVDVLDERIPQIDNQTERNGTEYRECLNTECSRTNGVRNYEPRHGRMKADKPSAFHSLNARNYNRDIGPSNNNIQGNKTIPFPSRRRQCCMANTSTSTNEGTIYRRHLGNPNGSSGPSTRGRTSRRLT